VQEKYLATILCNIRYISYLAIYRHSNFMQLKQDIKSSCNLHFFWNEWESMFST